MSGPRWRVLLLAALPALLWACGEQTCLPDAADKGLRPTLPEPTRTLLPTVNIAPAVGWPQGTAPTAAACFIAISSPTT